MAIDASVLAWHASLTGPRMANARDGEAGDARAAASDVDLMRRFQAGDGEAFQQLYLRHRDGLHRFVRRMAVSASEADDIFQDVWMAIIRDRARYVPGARFVTFLFTIAHQRAIDRWRAHGRVVEDPLPPPDTSRDAAFVVAPELEPDNMAQHAERTQRLLDAVAHLPPLQRAAFLMHADGGLTVEDIAQAMGSTRETAKSRLRYANQRLRRALAPIR